MSEDTYKLAKPVKRNYDHIQGPINAPITIVEYGDFECPYTGKAYPIVKEIIGRLGDSICFVFRNFPLNEIHLDRFFTEQQNPIFKKFPD